MLASKIIERSRSLADLQNSQAISYVDEVRSLNECYKDIYNQLCKSDNDYFVEEMEVSNWQIYKDSADGYTYTIPLASNFYQLRFVDYLDGTNWRPMTHMNINQRDIDSSEPIYRLKNSCLWVSIGSGGNLPSKIKISYYPTPLEITHPDEVKQYNMAITPYLSTTTTNNFYIPPITDSTLNTYVPDVMLYNYNNSLVAESILNQTTTTLLATDVTNVYYYKGYIYYIFSGSIYFSPYSPSVTTSLTSVPIVFSGTTISNITKFNIVNNVIYASNATTCIQGTINGTGSIAGSYFTGSAIMAYYPVPIGAYTCYIDLNSNIVITGNGIVTPLAIDSNIYTMLSYNETGIFALDSLGSVYKIVFDFTDPLVPTISSEIMYTDVSYMSQVSGNRMSIVRLNTIGNEAVSSIVDFDLSYPSNSLYEIISYQTAIDFKRKYDANNQDLMLRLKELWDTFMNSMIKQDNYKHERIQNVRSVLSNYNWNR